MEPTTLVEIVEEIIKVDVFPKLKTMILKLIDEAEERLNDPKVLRNKLESLKDHERLHSYAIQGLISAIESHAVTRMGGGGGDTNGEEDLSSQCDGSTKTFTIANARRITGVYGTQEPKVYRPTIDWTFSTATRILTLTDAVSAPQTGQTLLAHYIQG